MVPLCLGLNITVLHDFCYVGYLQMYILHALSRSVLYARGH